MERGSVTDRQKYGQMDGWTDRPKLISPTLSRGQRA